MLPIIKNCVYVSDIDYVSMSEMGYDLRENSSYDETLRRVVSEVEKIPAKSDYFPNTDWRENELSVMIPAGVDPGKFNMLKVSALRVGDVAQHAMDIITASGIDDIVEP